MASALSFSIILATCAAKMAFSKEQIFDLRLKMLSLPRLRPEIPQNFRRRVSSIEKR